MRRAALTLAALPGLVAAWWFARIVHDFRALERRQAVARHIADLKP